LFLKEYLYMTNDSNLAHFNQLTDRGAISAALDIAALSLSPGGLLAIEIVFGSVGGGLVLLGGYYLGRRAQRAAVDRLEAYRVNRQERAAERRTRDDIELGLGRSWRPQQERTSEETLRPPAAVYTLSGSRRGR
jgi:hypothetical protein